MPRKAAAASPSATPKPRRFTDEFRREAVQMLVDCHSAASVAERLGLSSPTILYRWKALQLRQAGPVARGSHSTTGSRTALRHP